jgi:hypothetical protein
VEVWALYNGASGRWEIDWEHNDAGEPTVAQVAEALEANAAAARYRQDLRVGTEAGAARRGLARCSPPGRR